MMHEVIRVSRQSLLLLRAGRKKVDEWIDWQLLSSSFFLFLSAVLHSIRTSLYRSTAISGQAHKHTTHERGSLDRHAQRKESYRKREIESRSEWSYSYFYYCSSAGAPRNSLMHLKTVKEYKNKRRRLLEKPNENAEKRGDE